MKQYLLSACLYATLALGCTPPLRRIEPDSFRPSTEERATNDEQTFPDETEEQSPTITPQNNAQPHTLERILFSLAGTSLAIAALLSQYQEKPQRYV